MCESILCFPFCQRAARLSYFLPFCREIPHFAGSWTCWERFSSGEEET